LVLVTGATGSGKSTTLAAMLHTINTTCSLHIVTIEDPIEFVHHDRKSRVTQREVGADTLSFHTALRHVVRQSPDVIMIGELRDMETLSVAISAALTGHLVLATLHTIDSTQTLQRILTYFPEHMRSQAALDLSMCLQGIISQRLIPRQDGKGRVMAVEVLSTTPAAARLIQEQRVDELQDLMRSASDPGILTFNQSLLNLYLQGQISVEIGKAHASNPDEFALSAQGMETGVASFQRQGSTEAATALDMKTLLSVATEYQASDLHLSVGRPPILRLDGELKALDVKDLSIGDLRLLLFSIFSARQRSVYELERELDFALALENGQRFRVNAYFHKGNMAASLRAIPSQIPRAEELELPETVLRLGERPHGLLLVVGPTGSGKTTTLACLVDRINRSRACRIITVEDPIEYVHECALASVDQREVHADTLSFASALKFVLRQDPDVIMIGEMRDLETISAALTAAETGHLVLTTLHTNDAVQTVDRIIDVFPSHQQSQVRSQLAASLLGIVSQRLLPRRDGQGRVACFEILLCTPAIRHMIRDNKMHQALGVMESSQQEGMLPLDRSLQDLLSRERITYEAALRYMRNPSALKPPRSPSQPLRQSSPGNDPPGQQPPSSGRPSSRPAPGRTAPNTSPSSQPPSSAPPTKRAAKTSPSRPVPSSPSTQHAPDKTPPSLQHQAPDPSHPKGQQ